MKKSAFSTLHRDRKGDPGSLDNSRRPLASTITEVLGARNCVGPVMAVILFAGVLPASAVTLSWDPNVTAGGALGGDGTWDFSPNTRWFETVGFTNVDWTDGNDAIFLGAPGTVTVGAAVAPASLKFDSAYTLNGAAITTGTLNVKDATAVTINNVFSGTGLTIGSTSLYGGTLTLGGASNYTGTTTITRGIVKLGAHDALPTGTTLTQSANPSSIFDLNGFNQTVAQIGGASQSIITNTSATTSTLTITTNSTITASSQILTGNLNVTKTGTGAWNPAVAHAFTGVLTLAGGSTLTSNNSQLGAIGQATILLDGTGTNTPLLTFNGAASTVAATWDRAIALAGTGGRITGSGVKAVTLSGLISGSGDLRYGSATQGAIILAGDNTYSGLTRIENTGTELIAANDNAFGQSPMISQSGTSISGTVGFQRSLTNQNINIGTTTDITFQANAHSSGLGSIHNFSGDNRFAGDIIMSANTQLYAAESESSLLLKGAISGARPFTKGYGGTIALSGANTYTGTTTVNNGLLRLDFSQAGAPTDNIINNVANTSSLTLAGGTLDIKGTSAASSQRFASTQFNAGASTLSTQNSAAGVTATLSGITRLGGSTVNFVLPSSGSIDTTSGGASTILLNSSGVAYATVSGSDWAAKADNGTSIVGLSSIGGYTATTATSLADNADVASGIDTTVGTTSNISTRFNVAEARAINLTGDLTTGGILVTPAVGNNVSTITGGNLTGPISSDLVVIQNNPSNILTIGSTIIDNTTTNLTKAGAGTLELIATNTYDGHRRRVEATGLGSWTARRYWRDGWNQQPHPQRRRAGADV